MDFIKDWIETRWIRLRIKYFEWKLRRIYKEDEYVYEEDQNFDAKK